jgi:hypothetical protein
MGFVFVVHFKSQKNVNKIRPFKSKGIKKELVKVAKLGSGNIPAMFQMKARCHAFGGTGKNEDWHRISLIRYRRQKRLKIQID